MYIKLVPRLLSIGALLVACSWVEAQVVPAATGPGESVKLVLGAGYSNFSMDWGPLHRSSGVSGWIGLYPFSGLVKGLGIEAEGRTSQWGNPIPHLREDTAQIGGIYTFRGLDRVHPYGKFLAGFGSMDFPTVRGQTPNFHHTTVFVDSVAGGAELRAHGHFWIRGEYQYQWWHDVYNQPGLLFVPNGITVGLQYNFRSFR